MKLSNKILIVSIALAYNLLAQNNKIYLPNEDSLAKKTNPQWYNDAKLGIFIHWGLYAVPAYAPPELDPGNVKDWTVFYKNNPYAEWYLNTMKFEGTPTRKYHDAKYGKDFSYYDFIPMFNEKTKKWNPDTWASLFDEIGAKYVVITTKHHDGFLLWDSKVPYPNYPPSKNSLIAERNIVAELQKSVKAKNIKFGVYYSGVLDWTFYKVPISNLWPDLFVSKSQTASYADYVTAHYNELIEKYKPDLLWNDINFPDKGDFVGVMANYFSTVPEGIINDRWNAKNKKIYGFTTPEYQVLENKVDYKWETCRGIGNSFGYNAVETDVHYISADKLIDMFVDIVSKNGNLLLNIGPDAEGNIPAAQLSRLHALGKWLKVNGEGIFGTSTFDKAEGKSDTKARIRFTRKGKDVYCFLLDSISVNKITIKDISLNVKSIITITGNTTPLKWSQKNNEVTIEMPKKWQNEYATGFKISNY